MKHTVILLLSGLLAATLFAADAVWTLWPAGSKDEETSLQIPPHFKAIPALVEETERTLINGRFRSADGTVEFAVTALYARPMPKTVQARLIPLPLRPGERVIERTPKTRPVKSEDGDYELYDEDITVEGPKGAYTRYFKIELSTGTLPGASSMLWELKVTSDSARKSYLATYREFKERVNLGED